MGSGCRTPIIVALVAAVLLSSCATALSGAYYQFFPSAGYYNGGTLYYLLTDASEQQWAHLAGANFTPLLANARYNSYLPSVYQVTNNVQNLVFSTQPSTGLRPNYMPLWRLYTVTWIRPPAYVLKSLADINQARVSGRVSVRTTSVVVGASVVVSVSGVCIRQGSCTKLGGQVLVRLPVYGVFVDGQAYRMLMLDFANLGEASAFRGNYAPYLSQFASLRIKGVPPSWQDIYSLWNVPSPGQLPVAKDAPGPFGPLNANANYTPLMNEFRVTTLASPPPLYTSYAAIVADALPTSNTNLFSFQPIIGQ